ncbi:MAG: histidine kinase, partial [Bacteroidota bacterium]
QGRLLQVELRPDRLEVVRTLPWSRSNASLLERDDHFVLNYQKENSFHLVDRKDGTAQTIPNPHSGQNIDMLLDSENQLWLASIGFGLWLQKGHPYLGQLPDQQGATYDVEILPNRHILVGGNEGIWWYDENLKLRGHQSGMEQVRGVKKLRGIGICAGTLRGETYFFNNESDLARNDLSHTTVVSSGLSGLVSAGEGEVLFSSYGAGLQLFSNGKMETYDSPALPNLMVEGLFQTSQGLWATSSSDGVLLFGEDRHQLFSKQTGLTSNNIYSIFESTADSIWMGAENGATLWDGRQTFVNFTSADGLAGKRITAFFKDKYKQVWAFSDAYLHRWNGRQWTALKSLSFQKTPAGRVYDVAYDATAHRVFVAATTGAFVLSLQDAKPMGEPIDFVLESIEGKDGPLEAEELNILPAENNSIRIQYALPSFTKWEANRSCFRLLEQGEDWTEARQVSSFQFENLPLGHYTLQAFAENPDGLRSDVQTLATVKILPPIWLSWWAIALEVLLGILLLGSLIAWYFQRKNKKRLAALKIERELQTERERISRDLHDNIGAQLTNITYKLDMAAHLSKNEEDARKMERVSDETRNTMKLLRDTIWALDKDEFSFEDLAGRLQLYVNKLEGIDIAFSVRKQIETDWMISSKEVLHLFRILQEAIQNIIKHANASRAEIVFNIKAQAFEIVVMDNGKGMTNNAADGSSHYGLDNMAFRAREIGADFSTQTNRPQGTVVSIVKKK